ncbi:MgtC/SapB family protein [Effusibacillus pohliae]|uniref:MgtC/SapB family protein n=1 Tax=Effusibacillus pohliae TaxID=232270 RepID=UPI000377B63A|nr:MgtC/SapB family protein [Effusibacillus pohliae]
MAAASDLHLVFLLRISLSILLGGLLGWERERKNKSAGLKTHILVSVSGCLLMWLSTYSFADFTNHPNARFDPARLAAQVGGGIGGFLAAGIVLRSDRFAISGYSTAAMLLLAMIVGFAVGSGQYFVATVTVALVILCMVGIPRLQKRIHKPQRKQLTYVSVDRPALLAEIAAILGQKGLNITDVSMHADEDVVSTTIEFSAPPVVDSHLQEVVETISKIDNVLSVQLESSGKE